MRLANLAQPQAFNSSLRSKRLTSQLGILLGIAFAVCFVTGLISHFIQHPPGWFWWPSRPANLYRVTQGLHVMTGLACVPLLGAKLWSVYPLLFERPPLRSIIHAVERASIAVLVAAALFQVVGGVLNIARWYDALPYFFTAGHYWVAWLAVGALVVHIGVKLPAVRNALSRPNPTESGDGLTRRWLLTTVGAAAGVITLATAGQTLPPLARVSPLAPRRPTAGPQGLPVNKTAAGANVRDRALDPAYRLIVAGPGREVALSLGDLSALPQHTVVLPIACVEGWSASGAWSGVRLRDLAELVGADPALVSAEIESLERGGRYRRSTVPSTHVRDSWTLIALGLNGAPLHLDHGYPARLVAPNRPGVLQTKWVSRISLRKGGQQS
ncbi:molybdopterin-binding protein [Couchioplanes caeruleus subsp. caeruleus]|uniref:Molybdopterin-binding protein n=1 Tax=Couchioplanes caeruleus subsp. caeruleus TaxID=56427 RepID=A0A1K0GKJ9_9ACTN|nr:molybdopterin-binding protein [Couchioplanes caeruleus subsp. caeruleus]